MKVEGAVPAEEFRATLDQALRDAGQRPPVTASAGAGASEHKRANERRGGHRLQEPSDSRSRREFPGRMARLCALAIVPALALLLAVFPGLQPGPRRNRRTGQGERPQDHAHGSGEVLSQPDRRGAADASEEQAQSLRLSILRELIDNEILMQRAEKLGLLATDEEVDSKLSEIKAPFTRKNSTSG